MLDKMWISLISLLCAAFLAAAPGGARERFVEVRSQPQAGFASKPVERLILHANGKEYVADWYVGFTHDAPKLSSDTVYDFVLVERSNPARYGQLIWHDIWRVSLKGRVLYDHEVCEVHHVRLRRVVSLTEHGYAGLPDDKEMERLTHVYPHSLTGRPILCPIGSAPSEGPTTDEILVCDQCEQAFQRLKKEPSHSSQRPPPSGG